VCGGIKKYNMMQTEEIVKFLKKNIEPIEDSINGKGYRAAVYLTDGTYLPCVIFRSTKEITNLAIRRFKEEQKGKGLFGKSATSYYRIVQHFVTSGNKINVYDIDKVEVSKNAFPLSIQKQIRGETTMGWTGFVVKMKDNKCFSYGTRFLMEFFEVPENYSTSDIAEIINHSYVSAIDGEVKSHRVPFSEYPDDYPEGNVLRERPFFNCYIEN
jgi:hypothetical protein